VRVGGYCLVYQCSIKVVIVLVRYHYSGHYLVAALLTQQALQETGRRREVARLVKVVQGINKQGGVSLYQGHTHITYVLYV
jgi:hypothetical protein